MKKLELEIYERENFIEACKEFYSDPDKSTSKVIKYKLTIEKIEPVYEYQVLFRRPNGEYDLSIGHYLNREDFDSRVRNIEFVKLVEETKIERK